MAQTTTGESSLKDKHQTTESFVPALIRSIRPKQWIKNLFVFAGVVFSGTLVEPLSLLRAIGAFAIFCGLSASTYLINDVLDRQSDRMHPRKALRPIAAGVISPSAATSIAVMLAAVCLWSSFQLNLLFAVTALAYFFTTVIYSLGLKKVLLLDVIVLATGFVLRAVAGAFAVGQEASPWLILLTILVASFFGLTKRRHELIVLGEDAAAHRAILDGYSHALLDQLISVVSSATLVSYALYTFYSEHSRHLALLIASFPIVLYSLFRYLYLVYRKDLGGNPEDLLLSDKPLAVSALAWIGTILGVIYWP